MTALADAFGVVRHDVTHAPRPVHWALLAGAVLGVVGAFVGLTVGLRSYVPTAWAAALEVGVPTGCVGAVLGGAAGVASSLVSRGRRRITRGGPDT